MQMSRTTRRAFHTLLCFPRRLRGRRPLPEVVWSPCAPFGGARNVEGSSPSSMSTRWPISEKGGLRITQYRGGPWRTSRIWYINSHTLEWCCVGRRLRIPPFSSSSAWSCPWACCCLSSSSLRVPSLNTIRLMAESAGPSVVKPPVVLPGGTGNNIIVNSCQASSPFSLCDVFQLVSCYRITFTGSVATLSLNALGMWVRNSAKLLQIIKLDAQLVSYFWGISTFATQVSMHAERGT